MVKRRWVWLGIAPVLLLAVLGAREQRLMAAARRAAAARQVVARLRALEDRVIFHPEDREALVALAQAYQAVRGPAEAAPLWERAAQPAARQVAPRPADDLIERAARAPRDLALQRRVVDRCQRLNRLPAAIPSLQRLTRADPADEGTWRRLGIAELQSGRTAAACGDLRGAVTRKPGDTVALFYLGLALSNHGDVAEALEAFGRVQRLRPDYAPAALERIRLEIEDWRLREAVAEARRLIQRRPRLADAYYQLGVALYDLHDLPAAEAALRTAARLDPHPARYHGWLGLTLLEQDRPAEATTAFEAAVAHNPGYSNGFYQLGRAYLLQGRLDEAEQALRRALILGPRFAEAYFSLGQLLRRRGQRAPAARLLARFQALSDFEQRRRYLERRAQVERGRPEWRRRLGDLYAREGLRREAQAQYERAGEIARAEQGERTAGRSTP